jgi:hypothetical protein
MIRGAIPVARRAGMGDEVFIAGEHYVEIPQDATPAEYADVILDASHMSVSEASRYQTNANDLLPMFDRKTVAQRLLDLAHGEVDTEVVQGTLTADQADKAEDILFNHFGVLL